MAEATRALAPAARDRHGPLPLLLLVLTAVTGVVDAVSYLALGRVFVANMTGNVVFLGFAIGGARDVSAPASLAALAAFLLGALAGGRLGAGLGWHRGYLLAATIAIKLVPVTAAVVVAMWAGNPLDDTTRYVLIMLLASAMGLQSATARSLGVPGLTTVVLTMTMTGLAADSWAGGDAPRPGSRLFAVPAMLTGAAIGGLLVLHVSLTAALGLAAGLLLFTGIAVYRLSSPAALWAAPL